MLGLAATAVSASVSGQGLDALKTAAPAAPLVSIFSTPRYQDCRAKPLPRRGYVNRTVCIRTAQGRLTPSPGLCYVFPWLCVGPFDPIDEPWPLYPCHCRWMAADPPPARLLAL